MVTMTRTFGSFSVDDLDRAAAFYRDVLGLTVARVAEPGPLWLHGPDGDDTLVYLKGDHLPATFTVLNVSVPDIGQAVAELTARGVTFEHYDGIPTDDRGILHGEGHSIAWFTDPAGNGLSLVEEA
jgi:catechol 2,3-dioxygenase-like lactoylglutathione lyase family enzyme